MWHRKRDRAEAASRDHARELLTMAAARRQGSASLYIIDSEDEAKLDEGLGFDMTAGQRRCWLDVEEDLCRRLAPMDRLVFGDVGFGRRRWHSGRAAGGARRAAGGGGARRPISSRPRGGVRGCRVDGVRRYAIGALTHKKRRSRADDSLRKATFKCFQKKLGPLNVSVELLVAPRPGETVEGPAESRQEARRVRAAVASGACEVCVGTHALLSPRQPGAILVWRSSTRQRFGVRQKERFKAACVDVDVLTLSATPMPRTLGAALAGLGTRPNCPKRRRVEHDRVDCRGTRRDYPKTKHSSLL